MFGVPHRPPLTPRSSSNNLKSPKALHIPDPTARAKSPFSPIAIKSQQALSPTSSPTVPDYIVPGLYLTDLFTARGVLLPSFTDLASRHKTPNIKYILSLLDNSLSQPKPRPGPLYAGKDAAFVQKLILIDDTSDADLLAVLGDACDWIEECIGNDDGGVMVHCQLGQSRSASVVIAYVMRKDGLNYDEALQKVKKKRGIVKPNVGFASQLQLWADMSYTIYEAEPVKVEVTKDSELISELQNLQVAETPQQSLAMSKILKRQLGTPKCHRARPTEERSISNLERRAKEQSPEDLDCLMYPIDQLPTVSLSILVGQLDFHCPISPGSTLSWNLCPRYISTENSSIHITRERGDF